MRVYTHNGHTHQILLHDMSDEMLANKVRMLMRSDLDHEIVVQAARDRIKCLSAEKAVLETLMTWQPIRTAPTDGTWFLCHHAGDDGIVRINSARWCDGVLGGISWHYADYSMPQYWMPISERFAE